MACSDQQTGQNFETLKAPNNSGTNGSYRLLLEHRTHVLHLTPIDTKGVKNGFRHSRQESKKSSIVWSGLLSLDNFWTF
jgi:hypothetical protein